MNTTLRIQSASRTDKGNVRQLNEDACLDLPGRCLWAVADGMGGHSGGDMASRMIVEALHAVPREATPGRVVDAVEDAIAAVNERLYDMSAEGESRSLIGSTLALLLAFPGHCVVGWVGDSRVYRLRDGQLAQLTQDHSEVEELIAQGAITRDEAQTHAAANVVTRAVGGTRSLFLELELQELQPDDRFLICSDGLYKELDDAQIVRYLGGGDVETACEALVEQALRRECRDNVTAVVVDFQRAGAAAVVDAGERTIVPAEAGERTLTPAP